MTKLKKELELTVLFNLIIIKEITPNQFYLLYSIHQGTSSLNINIHQEIRALISKDMITEKDGVYTITKLGIEILEEIESYFKVQKKKINIAIMGEDFGAMIIKYNELFPKIKLPSGKLARAALRNLETNFKWFFENFQYNWDVVLKATAAYVDEYERNNFNYMRTSMYFIKKQEQDKTITSDLADYCAMIESGGDLNTEHYFTTKAV